MTAAANDPDDSGWLAQLVVGEVGYLPDVLVAGAVVPQPAQLLSGGSRWVEYGVVA